MVFVKYRKILYFYNNKKIYFIENIIATLIKNFFFQSITLVTVFQFVIFNAISTVTKG